MVMRLEQSIFPDYRQHGEAALTGVNGRSPKGRLAPRRPRGQMLRIADAQGGLGMWWHLSNLPGAAGRRSALLPSARPPAVSQDGPTRWLIQISDRTIATA
jgi:hypothetical protein